MERRGLSRLTINDTTLRFKKLSNSMFWARLSPHFQVLNLSKSGLSFETTFPLKIGDKLYIKAYFPDGMCIPLKGVVKWKKTNSNVEHHFVGVQFLPFGDHHEYNDLNSLRYLRKLLPSSQKFSDENEGDFANLS